MLAAGDLQGATTVRRSCSICWRPHAAHSAGGPCDMDLGHLKCAAYRFTFSGQSKADAAPKPCQRSASALLTQPASAGLAPRRQASHVLLPAGGARKPVHQRLVFCCSYTCVCQGEAKRLGAQELQSSRVARQVVLLPCSNWPSCVGCFWSSASRMQGCRPAAYGSAGCLRLTAPALPYRPTRCVSHRLPRACRCWT